MVRPFLVLTLVAVATVVASAALAETPAEVRKRFEAETTTALVGTRGVELGPLREFYKGRNWVLAWTGANETAGEHLLIALQTLALAEGMPPEAYAVPATNNDLDHDMLVSDALARFGRDLSSGRVAPSRSYGGLGPETRPAFDAVRFLRDLAAGRPLADLAATMPPGDRGYVRLKEGLARYRQLARSGGGWGAIPDGPSIKPGAEDPRVPAVRLRLIATGELEAEYAKGDKLDAPVTAALKRFQARHGLDEDGAVGRMTLAALNVPLEDRIRQLALNLERWRWMPRQMEPHRIAVNLPAAQLELVEPGGVAMRMRVVVGDTKHPTPTMAATMTSLVLNPPWSVPPSIATKEILPKLRRDPNYLISQGLRITAFPEDSPEALGTGVDWTQTGTSFPYRLRQPPGPDNALGQVKFFLKDSDDIYLHDTNNRKVFAKSQRALSHGCVRVEKPLELARQLLSEEWRARVEDLIGDKATRTLKLDRPMVVYLLYFTAWADEDGLVHFRDDLYGHDARLRAGLKRAGSTPQVAQHQGNGTL